MDELQAGIEMSLAVLPQAPVLVQPGKTPLHNPALGDDRKLVKFAALGNLHRDLLPQGLFDRLRKGIAHISCRQRARFAPCSGLALHRLSACNAPLRSVTSAVVTATACGRPCVSTPMWRLMPETFLPASYPLSAAVSVFLTLCASTINSVGCALRPSFKRAAPT